MNYAQAAVEYALGYEVDWVATGAWFGGAMTAVAVGIAANLSKRTAERQEQARTLRDLRALMALYDELEELVVTFLKFLDPSFLEEGEDLGYLSIPTPEQFDDIGEALSAVSILYVPEPLVIQSMVRMRQVAKEASGLATAWRSAEPEGGILKRLRELRIDTNSSRARIGTSMRGISKRKPNYGGGWLVWVHGEPEKPTLRGHLRLLRYRFDRAVRWARGKRPRPPQVSPTDATPEGRRESSD